MRFRKTLAFFILNPFKKTSSGSSKIISSENLTHSITASCENCLMFDPISNFNSWLKGSKTHKNKIMIIPPEADMYKQVKC